MPLNQYQLASVTVSLRLLERALAQIEDLLVKPGGGVLYQTRMDISDAQRTQVLSLIEQARDLIHVLVGTFGLRAEVVSASQVAKALLSQVWADLEDTRPTKLRRYGDVAPELDCTLGPQVDKLIGLVVAMMALVEPVAPEPSGRQGDGR